MHVETRCRRMVARGRCRGRRGRAAAHRSQHQSRRSLRRPRRRSAGRGDESLCGSGSVVQHRDGRLAVEPHRDWSTREVARSDSRPRPSKGSTRSTSWPPRPLDVSLGGLPAGRRPVAVLDKSIVLVPASTAGPPVEVWGGRRQPERRRRRWDGSSPRRMIVSPPSTTAVYLVRAADQHERGRPRAGDRRRSTGFQPVSTGSFSPNGRYIVVRYANEHRPFDGVAIVDLATRHAGAADGRERR